MIQAAALFDHKPLVEFLLHGLAGEPEIALDAQELIMGVPFFCASGAVHRHQTVGAFSVAVVQVEAGQVRVQADLLPAEMKGVIVPGVEQHGIVVGGDDFVVGDGSAGLVADQRDPVLTAKNLVADFDHVG